MARCVVHQSPPFTCGRSRLFLPKYHLIGLLLIGVNWEWEGKGLLYMTWRPNKGVLDKYVYICPL